MVYYVRNIIFVLLLILSTISTKTSVSFGTTARSDTLNIGLISLPNTLHPLASFSSLHNYGLGFWIRPLTSYNAKNELVCKLCSTLPSYEKGTIWQNSDQTVTVQFTIDPQLFWSDGVPVSTDDLIFTWMVSKSPKSGLVMNGLFTDDIQNIEKIDEKNVRITRKLNQNNPADFSDFWVISAHIESEIWEKYGAENYLKHSHYILHPSKPGLSNGPYQIHSFNLLKTLKFSRNPYWTASKPFFSEINLIAYNDATTLDFALINQQIDLSPSLNAFSHDHLKDLQKKLKNHAKLKTIPSLSRTLLLLNLNSEKLKDASIRRALLFSINTDAINQALFGNLARVSYGLLTEGEPYYKAPPTDLGFRPQKSRELFKQQGWHLNPKTKLLEKNQTPFTLEIITSANNASHIRILEIIQGQLKAQGILVKIKTQPPRVYFGETLKKRQFQDMVLITWPKSPNFIPTNALACGFIPSSQNHFLGYNYSGYCNPEMDQKLSALNGKLSDEQQQQIWSEIQDIYARDLPVLSLFSNPKEQMLKNDLGNIELMPHYYPESLWAEEWYRR